MKALKSIGITLLVLIGLFFAIGLFLPSEVHVEREKKFSASAKVIFNEVNSLKNWADWDPWSTMSDDMATTYSGPPSGEGATSSWTSKSMGDGTQTIVESRPYEFIKTDLDFQEQGTATSTWQFIAESDSTRVIWTLDADMGSNVIDKYMGLLWTAWSEAATSRDLIIYKNISGIIHPIQHPLSPTV